MIKNLNNLITYVKKITRILDADQIKNNLHFGTDMMQNKFD